MFYECKTSKKTLSESQILPSFSDDVFNLSSESSSPQKLSKSSHYHWIPHNFLGISTEFILSFHPVKLVKIPMTGLTSLNIFILYFSGFFIMKTPSKLYGNIGLLQHLSNIFFIFLYSFTLWKVLWKPYRNVRALQDFQQNFLIVCSGFSQTKKPNKFV